MPTIKRISGTVTPRTKEPMIPVLQKIIGEIATERLIAAFGGDNLKVPKGTSDKQMKTFTSIMNVIGEDATRKLCKYFALDRIYIPKNLKKVLNERNRRIVTRYDQGARLKELVDEFNLTERHLRSILKDTDMTADQPS